MIIRTANEMKVAIKDGKTMIVSYRETMFGSFRNIWLENIEGKWTENDRGEITYISIAKMIEKYAGYEIVVMSV